MKDETGGVTIKKFVGLTSKRYLFLLDNSSEYKKHRMWIKMLLQQ